MAGRKPIPDEIRNEVIRLKKEDSKLSARVIAVRLPSFKLKDGREARASYVWVSKVLRESKVVSNENSPVCASVDGVKTESGESVNRTSEVGGNSQA